MGVTVNVLTCPVMVITDVYGVGVHVMLVEGVVSLITGAIVGVVVGVIVGVEVVVSRGIETGIIVGCCVMPVDVVGGI